MNSPIQALACTITEKFILATPQKAAAALEALATHEVLQLVSPLKAQVIITVLNVMAPAKAAAVLRRLPLRQASYVLARLQVPQAARLMQEFSAPYRERISAVLEPAFLQLLNQRAAYEPKTVGSRMLTDFISVRTDMKLSQLTDRLKNLPRKKIPSLCLVTDKDGVLKGVLRPVELAFYAPHSVIGSVMSASASVAAHDLLERAQEMFTQYETDVLPVVNENQVCVGLLLKSALPSPVEKKSFWRFFR